MSQFESTYQDQKLEARVSAAQKQRIEQAAARCGKSVNSFVADVADNAASEILDEDRIIDATARDMEMLLDMLETPCSEPSPTVSESLELYNRLVIKE